MILGLIAFMLLVADAAPAKVTKSDRVEALRNAALLLEQRYVDAAQGAAVAEALRAETIELSRIEDPKRFADAVTDWLRRRSGDGHLGLSYSERPIPEQEGEADYSAAEMEKYYGAHVNHGVEKIERLPGNIMLLDLRVFPPREIGGDVVAAAMTVVAQGDALIIDLRRNGGGSDTSDLLSGYLLRPGSPLSGSYDRPSNIHRPNLSPQSVPGRRFGTVKPVFILTSRRTFSAAEAVAYDLQALKRATIVGEVTGGGAHPFAYRRVQRQFALELPEGKSINPVTGGNWQGVGVKPDFVVPADRALDKALELARVAIESRSTTGSDPHSD